MKAQLELQTLGRLKISLNGVLVNGELSDKGKGMLVYLAANPQEHPRHKLANFILSDTQPISSFRRELFYLRRLLGDFLDVTNSTVKISDSIECRFDGQLLERHVPIISRIPDEEITSEQVKQLEDVLLLYKGDFLEGLHVDTVKFEMWASILSINYQILATSGWEKVVDYYLKTGDYVRGVQRGLQLLRVDDSRSESYCKMMLLLACLGQRHSAIKIYEHGKKRILEMIGGDPPEEMVNLFRKIRSGTFSTNRS